jgi:hypothetical protein
MPLTRPERQGVKDVPASYHILIAFVNAANGSTVYEHSFTPAIPTTSWYTAEPIRIEEAIHIPTSVPAGKYGLRIALVNPNLPPNDEQRYFRLVNVDLHDGSGRYSVGQITTVSEFTPIATAPTGPTPTPSPLLGKIGDWLSSLLRSIWQWFRNLLTGPSDS